MPGNNPLLRNWQSELKVFQTNLSLLRKEMNGDAIHELRVAIKKLRSYFKLYVALVKKNDGGQLPGKTRELFTVLGKNRNLEMCRELVLSFGGKKNKSLHSLLLYLQLLQDQTSEYCQEAIKNFKIKELKELTEELENDLEKSEPGEILNGTGVMIASLMEHTRDNMVSFGDRSHLIRKDLKDIFYMDRIFKENKVLKRSQSKEIDRILIHLGNVQDHEVMITNLEHFRKTIISKGDVGYELIKEIELKGEKKKSSLLEKAATLTEALLKDYKKTDAEVEGISK